MDNTTLGIAKELIKFNTENPPADTRQISKYIAGILDEHSIKYSFIKNKNRIYITSQFGSGPRKIVLYGHSDVVVAGDRNKWKSGPFSPTVKNGNLYGRGSADMKGGLAAEISAFTELFEQRSSLKGKVELLVCPEEEDYDSTRLLPKIIKNSGATACIMGEPHFDDIIIGEKGEFDIKLRAFGKSSHGSTPAAGIDAKLILDDIIDGLKNTVEGFNQKIKSGNNKLDGFMKKSTVAMSEEFKLSGEQKRNFISSNPAGTITMNVGYYSAGRNYNIVPDEAQAHIVIMVPYGFDYKNIARFLTAKVKGCKGNVIIDELDGRNASLTDSKDRLVSSLSAAYTSVKKKKPALVFDTGSTDAAFYREQNIPTVIYGPGYFYNAHVYNEFVSIKEMESSKHIYKRAVINYLS